MAVFTSHNDTAARVAEAHGCSPFWCEAYKAFCCGCDDLRHACDQQCSVITNESALRQAPTVEFSYDSHGVRLYWDQGNDG